MKQEPLLSIESKCFSSEHTFKVYETHTLQTTGGAAVIGTHLPNDVYREYIDLFYHCISL